MPPLSRSLAVGSDARDPGPATILTAQTTDRAIGSWTLDVAKSTYSLTAMPKSLTVTYATAGQGLHSHRQKASTHRGTRRRRGYTANYDGQGFSRHGLTRLRYGVIDADQCLDCAHHPEKGRQGRRGPCNVLCPRMGRS